MSDFPKDIWQSIIRFIDNPKDYRNFCCISKIVYRASLETRYKKGVEFSKCIYDYQHHFSNIHVNKYYILPNQHIHGCFEKISIILPHPPSKYNLNVETKIIDIINNKDHNDPNDPTKVKTLSKEYFYFGKAVDK
jgi:hypothetical protein